MRTLFYELTMRIVEVEIAEYRVVQSSIVSSMDWTCGSGDVDLDFWQVERVAIDNRILDLIVK